MKMTRSNWLGLDAIWASPRSQFVPPEDVSPSMRLLITAAPAGVDTDWRVSRFALLVVFAGAFVANVNIDIRDGVPVNELTSVLAAFFRFGNDPPTEPDTSMRSPT